MGKYSRSVNHNRPKKRNKRSKALISYLRNKNEIKCAGQSNSCSLDDHDTQEKYNENLVSSVAIANKLNCTNGSDHYYEDLPNESCTCDSSDKLCHKRSISLFEKKIPLSPVNQADLCPTKLTTEKFYESPCTSIARSTSNKGSQDIPVQCEVIQSTPCRMSEFCESKEARVSENQLHSTPVIRTSEKCGNKPTQISEEQLKSTPITGFDMLSASTEPISFLEEENIFAMPKKISHEPSYFSVVGQDYNIGADLPSGRFICDLAFVIEQPILREKSV